MFNVPRNRSFCMSVSSCQINYRISERDIKNAPRLHGDTFYVIGGLYGNPFALDTILAMKQKEEKNVHLVFNGDFNWFNNDKSTLLKINTEVFNHDVCCFPFSKERQAIKGNVEEEIESFLKSATSNQPPQNPDCGCNYPSYVDPIVPKRSNEIMGHLLTAVNSLEVKQKENLCENFLKLSKVLRLKVGNTETTVLHGDCWSLSGWKYAVEIMEPKDPQLQIVSQHLLTSEKSVIGDFGRIGDSDIMAVTHTCLPFVQDYQIPNGGHHVLINNGSAGMPNFSNKLFGVISRISNVGPHPDALYGTGIRGKSITVEALPVSYSHSEFCAYFERNWKPNSPAYLGYWNRITRGPLFSVEQAQRFHKSNK